MIRQLLLKKKANRLFYGALICIAIAQPVSAMDFSWSGSGNAKLILQMKGDVNAGDYEKFRKFMLDNLDEYSKGTRIVSLASNGGDVVETLKIAKLLRAMYATVVLSDAPCASSCFFLYISAINRASHGKIGIHRVYFDRSYFAGLSLKDAERSQAELTKSVNALLEDNSVPRYLIETMNRTSSSEIHWLSDKEIGDLGERPAWYEEFLIAKCGYDKGAGERYNEHPENPELERAWLANFTKVQPCEEKFLATELEKLSALLQPPAVEKPILKKQKRKIGKPKGH